MTPQRTASLVLIAAIIVLVVYFSSEHPTPRSVATAQLPAGKAGSAVQSVSASVAASQRTVMPGSPPTAAHQLAPAMPDAAVCDHIGMIAKQHASNEEKTAALELAASTAKARLSEALNRITQNAPPLEKAAAHYSLAYLHKHPFPADDDERDPLCPDKPGCKPENPEVESNPVYKNVNELAKLAVGSSDPAVYALAFWACHSEGYTKNGFCSQINAAQWVHLDPENGMALLYLIGEIDQTSKSTPKSTPNNALNDALYRFSQAKKFDTRFSTLVAFQRRELAKMDDVMQRFVLMQTGNTAYAYATLPKYKALTGSCNPKDLTDPNRRQVCDAIAHRLLNEGTLLINYGIGRAMARKLGWPEQQMIPIDNEFFAMSEAFRLADQEINNSLKKEDAVEGCLASLKSMRHMEKSMALGEVALAKQLISQQPLSQAELAANYKTRNQPVPVPASSSPAK